MKRRIALALSMLMMVLMLGACGTDPTTVDYNGKSYSDLQDEMTENVLNVSAIALIYKQYGFTSANAPQDLKDQLLGMGATQVQLDAAVRWEEVAKEFGEPAMDETTNELPMDTFTVAKAGKTLTTDLVYAFPGKDINIEVVYDYYSMEVTGISIEPVYTMGEKLAKAGMNTLISISIVFAVLILISLLIAAFKIFPYLENIKAKKKAGVAQVAPEVLPEAPVVQENTTEDTELIAVIAAAIAASEGTSTSDFVVRSINRR